MKILGLHLFLIIFFITYMTSAYGYKFSIYTDETNNKKADEVINAFKTTYPFNQFSLEFEVKKVEPSKLNCAPRLGIDRLLGCDTEDIARDAAKRGVDQVFIVKDSPKYGGSGGGIPVMSSSSPTSMLIHEYLHTLGLCDEYEYSKEEASIYCVANGANLALINPDPKGYKSDSEARSKHMGNIPWAGIIKPQTLITNIPNLGTASVDHSTLATPNSGNSVSPLVSVVGLYRGKTCDNAVIPKVSWNPGREASIMQYLEAGIGAGNEQIVARILDSKGVPRKLNAPPPLSKSINDSNRESKPVENLEISNAASGSIPR